jgi:hypothetical protein
VRLASTCRRNSALPCAVSSTDRRAAPVRLAKRAPMREPQSLPIIKARQTAAITGFNEIAEARNARNILMPLVATGRRHRFGDCLARCRR